MATNIDLRPARLDYKVVRGDDFADTVTINEGDPPEPADLTGRVYTAQVRRSANGPVVAQMDIDDTDLADGIVQYAIEDAVTATMNGTFVWDLQQDVGGSIRTLMGGKFVVYVDVTRAV